MLFASGCSELIFGSLLWGDKPLRYIFMDEAGTSQHEPVTVVVGLIAHAEEHVLSAELLVREALGAVPKGFREDFVFHATQVYGDKKFQNAEWGLTDRLNLLIQMMSIPRRIGMAVTVAVHWRGSVDFSNSYELLGMSPEQSDHYNAFQLCIAVADRNIRMRAGPREVASVVAEDVPDMKKHLKEIPRILRENAHTFPQSHMRHTADDIEAGYMTQNGDYRVTRMRNSVHFVEKAEDPLVQVADACAYGFRRFFAQEKFGVEFVRAIIGNENLLRNFASPGGAECYWPVGNIQ